MLHAVNNAFEVGLVENANDNPKPLTITLRQAEVLGCVSQGHLKSEVGRILYMSEATVRTHIHNIIENNNLSNMAHGVTLGYLSGQLPWTNK